MLQCVNCLFLGRLVAPFLCLFHFLAKIILCRRLNFNDLFKPLIQYFEIHLMFLSLNDSISHQLLIE